MLKEQYEDILNNITKNLSDQGQVTKLLNELREDYEKQLNDLEKFKNSNEDLLSKNENLRASNMQLFLKLGAKKEEDNKPDEKEETNENNENDEKDKKSFENLFDENGGLK